MARRPRIEFPGAVYHVTSRGTARTNIFLDETDRAFFLHVLANVIQRYALTCHGYCLMKNHYHLVLATREPNLAGAMQQLNGRTAQTFNWRHGRVGHLYQGRYDARLIEHEAHTLEVCRYVVLNPIRAGFCELLEYWPWSSFRATAGIDDPPSFLTTSWLLRQFARDEPRARELYRAFVTDGAGLSPGVVPGV